MVKSWILGATLVVLSVCGAAAQQSKSAKKARKSEAVVTAQKAVNDDKAQLNTLRDKKTADKFSDDKEGVRADRKAILKTDKRLLKHRVKRDVAKVKKVL